MLDYTYREFEQLNYRTRTTKNTVLNPFKDEIRSNSAFVRLGNLKTTVRLNDILTRTVKHEFYIENLEVLRSWNGFRQEWSDQQKAERLNRLLHKDIIWEKWKKHDNFLYNVVDVDLYERAINSGVNIEPYFSENIATLQTILWLETRNISYNIDLIRQCSYAALEVYKRGLESGIDMSFYLDKTISVNRLNFILGGLELEEEVLDFQL